MADLNRETSEVAWEVLSNPDLQSFHAYRPPIMGRLDPIVVVGQPNRYRSRFRGSNILRGVMFPVLGLLPIAFGEPAALISLFVVVAVTVGLIVVINRSKISPRTKLKVDTEAFEVLDVTGATHTVLWSEVDRLYLSCVNDETDSEVRLTWFNKRDWVETTADLGSQVDLAEVREAIQDRIPVDVVLQLHPQRAR